MNNNEYCVLIYNVNLHNFLHIFNCLKLIPTYNHFMKIIFAWWWTWWHLHPSIAIAGHIQWDVLFIIWKSILDKQVLRKTPFKYRQISSWKLRRYFDLKNFTDIFSFLIWIIQSFFIIKSFSPDVIFCKWWYISLPVAISWWILRKKIILHESDSVLWMANSITSRFSNKLIMWLEQNLNPIRYNENELNINLIKDIKSKSKWKKILFIMWGSQGAQQLNELVIEIFENIKKNYYFIHLTWKWKKTFIKSPSYIQFEYLDNDYFSYLFCADLVISRAWASSIAEILALKKPSLLIPLPNSASNHQEINAKIIWKKWLTVYITKNLLHKENIINIISNNEILENIENNLKLIESHNVIDTIIAIIQKVIHNK